MKYTKRRWILMMYETLRDKYGNYFPLHKDERFKKNIF